MPYSLNSDNISIQEKKSFLIFSLDTNNLFSFFSYCKIAPLNCSQRIFSAMFCLPPGWDDLHPGRRREHFHRQDFSSHRHQTLHLYCSHHLTLRLIIIMARLFISLFSSSDCVSLLSILYFKPQPILITQLCISLSGLCCISMPIHLQSLTAILFFLSQLFSHFIF